MHTKEWKGTAVLMPTQREQEQRESLADTLRSLRSEVTRSTQTIDALETRNEDLVRQLSLANSQERAARLASRTAEASAKALREETVRMKATVQQIRASCANDIRKRDVQIQRLKTHLTVQQRGNKTGLVGASITITPGALGMGNGSKSGSRSDDSPNTDDPEYSLRQETTEFLTQLSQSLSDENDNLIGLVRSSLATLKELQGLPENAERVGSQEGSEEQDSENDMLQTLPTSYESLAVDMHGVLENLRNLLTNPNFVSIDEVSAREEEILRLREGFTKLEGRWREAVALMDGWRKRMLSGGGTVNIDEIRHGIGLGHGFGASVALRDDHVPEESEMDAEVSFEEPKDLTNIEEAPSMLEEMDLLPAVISNDSKSRNTRSTRKSQPLQENGNALSPHKSATMPTKVAKVAEAENEELVSTSRSRSRASKQESTVKPAKEKDSRIPRKVSPS